MSVFKGSVYKSTVFKTAQGVTASLDVTLGDAMASAGATARRFVDASVAAESVTLAAAAVARRIIDAAIAADPATLSASVTVGSGKTLDLDAILGPVAFQSAAIARRIVFGDIAAADAGLVSTATARRVAALAATLDSILFNGQIGEGVQPSGGKKRRGGELRYPSRRWEAEREPEEKKPDQPLSAAREAESRPIVPGATVPVKRRFTQRATDLRDLGKLLGLTPDALERARRARELDEDDEDVLMLLG